MKLILGIVPVINIVLALVMLVVYIKVIIDIIVGKISTLNIIFLVLLVVFFLISLLLRNFGITGSFFVTPIPYFVIMASWLTKLIFYLSLRRGNFSWSPLLLIDVIWTVLYLSIAIYASVKVIE